MSQERIIELLNKGKPLTRAELQEITNLAQQSISYALKQLIKYGEIEKGFDLIPTYSIKKRKKRRAFKPPIKNKN